MQSGSIFVCFLCENEFRDVELLQEHMKDHDSVPEMSNELPLRKRSSNKERNKLQYKTVKKQKVSSISSNDFKSCEMACSTDTDIDIKPQLQAINVQNKEDTEKMSFLKQVHIKEDPLSENVKTVTKKYPFAMSKRGFALSRKRYPVDTYNTEKTESIKEFELKKPKIEQKSPDDIQMLKAMRLKQIILNRELFAKKIENDDKKKINKKLKESEIDEESIPIDDVNGSQESIVMVESSFFSSGTSANAILGPTIMNAEPDGFVCPVPQKSYAEGAPYHKKKKTFARKSNKASIASYAQGMSAIKLEIEDDDYLAEDIVDYSSAKDSLAKKIKGKKRDLQNLYEEEQGYGDGDDEDDDDWEKKVTVRHRGKSRRGADDAVYQCLACNKQFKSLSTMKTHSRSHNEDKEIHCPYCAEVFPQRYILYEHLVNDHEESSNLTCPICNKIFTRPDSLKSHMVRMHEENGGLNCQVCNKNFPSQGQLEMHMRVHTGERPFKCDICGKGFVQKIHLKTHLRTMHNVTDMPTTPCRLCDLKFDGRVSLRDHYYEIHSLSSAEYKLQVARLRKEGKIPEMIPSKVKVVEPSFLYKNVSVADMDSDNSSSHTDSQAREYKPSKNISSTKSKKVKKNVKKSSKEKVPGMGTVMNLINDDDMFTPFSYDIFEEQQGKGRDQEELNIVESAFKVAEEMDQMGETSSTLIVSGENAGVSDGMYYSVPIVLSSDRKRNGVSSSSSTVEVAEEENEDEVDDEYAQFTAEHAHIDGAQEFEEPEMEIDSGPPTTIVKAEPLQMYSSDQSQAVEMFTM